MKLFEKIENREERIFITDFNYAEIPIAVTIAKEVNVIGFDLNKKFELYKWELILQWSRKW